MALTPTTWNPSDKNASITLSNGNLTGISSVDNVGMRSIYSASAGKFYWETTYTTKVSAPGTGVCNASTSLATAYTSLTNIVEVMGSGTIYQNGVSSGSTIATIATGNVIGIAVDLDNRRIWFRNVSGSGAWNGSGAANPATNAGGIAIVAGTTYPLFAHAYFNNSDATTTNFGATALSGAVPSGFNAGFGPVLPTTAQLTQIALEQYGVGTPSAQLTQMAIEHWAAVSTTNPRAILTQLALEQWASVAQVSAAIAQARAMIMA